MDVLPIVMKIAGRPCVVVGGGEVAACKVARLRQGGARVTVVAPALCPALFEMQARGEVQHRAARFAPADLDGATLVIAATDDRWVNAEVSRLAQARSVPVNVAHDPELSSFLFSPSDDRSPGVSAASTGGASPVPARRHAGRPAGEVYLVGAGPGNPDLLTIAALRLMQQADVVLYDNLVSPPILALTRRDAERVYVGKRRANHAMRQEQINARMIGLARAGRRVLRLKGGDPYTFGRGGEEIESLAAAGIRFEVVPGITAAAGVAAYAGIPLTHRDHAHSCVLVTGHLKDGTMDLDWHGLARPKQTLVIYMGLLGLDALCRQLMAHGLSAGLPAAVVQQGTMPQQRVVTATLGTLAAKVEAARLHAPTLVFVGEVVRLRDRLNWFDPVARTPVEGQAA